MTDFISTAMSETNILARSKRLYNKADDVYSIIRIPRYAVVTELLVQVTTPYSGGTGDSSSLLVGFSGNKEVANPDAFIDSIADCEVAGMYRMTDDAAAESEGKWFNDGSGMLTITLDHGDHTVLLDAMVFMQYSVLY